MKKKLLSLILAGMLAIPAFTTAGGEELTGGYEELSSDEAVDMITDQTVPYVGEGETVTGDVYVTKSESWSGKTVKGNAYVYEGASLTLYGNTTIEGNFYVLGMVYANGPLTVKGTLKCLYCSLDPGAVTSSNGHVYIMSESHVEELDHSDKWISEMPAAPGTSPTPTPTPSVTVTPPPTATVTPTPTAEPTGTVTPTPSAEPTETVTPTPSAEPTESVTPTPSAEPTESVTPTPSAEPTESVTPTPSAEPTESVTPTPSAEPTGSITPTPSAEPTGSVTPTPGTEPTETVTPTPEETETPTPTPTHTPVIADIKDTKVMGLDEKLVFSPGTKYSFTVIGAGTDNTDPGEGDTRWLPLYWKTTLRDDGDIYKHWVIGAKAGGIETTKDMMIYVFLIQQRYVNGVWMDTETEDYISVTVHSQGYSLVSITGFFNSVKGGDIRWKAVPEATGYAVYRKRAADGTKKIATVDADTLQYYDGDIATDCWGRVYVYYVCPIYGTLVGPAGDMVTLQRLAPMKFTSNTNSADGAADLKWACTVNANKALGYEIQYATSKEDLFGQKGSFVKMPIIEGRSKLSTTVTGLTKGNTYYFRIRAYVNYTHSVTGKTTKTWSQYSDVVQVKITR